MKAIQITLFFYAWFSDHFRIQSVLTPFSTVNKMTINIEGQEQKGVVDYYVFFLRVARIQKTAPWSYR